MAISRITSQDNLLSSAAASVTGGYPSTPTINHVLVACCFGSTVAPTSTGWTSLSASGAASNNVSILALVADGSTNSWTFSAASATVMRVELYDYSGVNTSLLTDGSNNAVTASGVSLAAGSFTTTNANDLLIGVWGWNGTTSLWSVDSGYTVNLTDARCVSADQVVSATGTYNPTLSWTTTRTSRAAHASLQASTVTPPASVAPPPIVMPPVSPSLYRSFGT